MSRKREINELLDNHRRFLHQLNVQKATLGIQTPPGVILQIQDAEKEIAALECLL